MMETQDSIGRWAGETFPGGDAMSHRHFIRMLEEVVELCVAAGAEWSDVADAVNDALEKSIPADMTIDAVSGVIVYGNPQPEKVGDEIADAAILLAVAAHKRGIDLQAEVDKKMAINRARRWQARGDGTGYHIKDV